MEQKIDTSLIRTFSLFHKFSIIYLRVCMAFTYLL